MFGNEITLADTGIITILGMSVVFIVLTLLIVVLHLFKYISVETVSQKPTNIPTSIKVTNTITALEKAIIISAILEDLGIQENKQQIRIKNICKIS